MGLTFATNLATQFLSLQKNFPRIVCYDPDYFGDLSN